MKVYTIRKMKSAEKDPHDDVTAGNGKGRSNGKAAESDGATAQYKKPTEQFNPARSEKAGGVNGAAVEKNPANRQGPGKSRFLLDGKGEDKTDNSTDEKGRKQGLSYPLGRWGPERFPVFKRLAASQEISAAP